MNGKRRGTRIQWNVNSAIKKNGIVPFAATQMDSEGITLSEISQRERGTVWCHLHEESEKYNRVLTSDYNKRRSRLTDTDDELVLTRGGEI